MKLEHKQLAFELRSGDGDGSTFEGLASGFHNVDSYGDIMCPGCFTDGLPWFLANGFVGGLNHDWNNPIGKPTKATEIPQGLDVAAKISATTAGADAMILIKDKVIQKLSIGFVTLGRTWLYDVDDVMNYWANAGYTPTSEDVINSQYGVRLITKVKLYEFSPVTVPANSLCDITNAKGDPLTGLTFDDHFLSVLATVEEYTERAEGLLEKRAEDGRSLSPSRIAQLKRLQARIVELIETESAARGTGKTPALASAESVQKALAAYTATMTRFGGSRIG